MALSRPRKLLYGLGTATVVLAAIELTLRFTTPYVAAVAIPSDEIYSHIRDGGLQYHEELGWEWAKLPLPGLQLNEYGFRYGDISVEKPANTFRAFTIGDSQTHGAGVPGPLSYTGLAETRLRLMAPPELDVELVSASCNGYSSLQALRLIRIRLLDFDPDLIVIDCMGRDSERDQEVGARRWRAVFDRVLFHSRIYIVLTRLLQGSDPMGSQRYGFHGPTRRTLNSVDTMEGYGNHDLIAELAQEEGFALIFGNYPVWNVVDDTVMCMAPDFTLPDGAQISRFCEGLEDCGIPVPELFLDGNHLTLTGNKVVADVLVESIVDLWEQTGVVDPAGGAE
jgi:hypothetical protein